ncbi:MAG: septum formation initiator family protein [Oscillospiraceae bacterium]|nr:septum formation initiator family protein [Oscillospiraceae bacterium]
MPRKRNKPRFHKLEPLLLLIITYLAIWGFVNILRLQLEKNQNNRRFEELKSKYTQQLGNNERLRQQLEKSSGEDFIEQKARDLDYVYPEEHVFVDTSGNF